MHEFSLVEVHDNQIGDYVICGIRNKNAKVDTQEKESPMKKMRSDREDHNPPEPTSSASPLQIILRPGCRQPQFLKQIGDWNKVVVKRLVWRYRHDGGSAIFGANCK
ncbi:hypothetical protein J1N35_032980 [Gossypium stocksii]|uniref:Uncharacterized protein n=1 Tax=Gossypium stocksii TaxID=47602 RepID=A0A9D3UPA2_9ROSI|nr:hypothetical protein J1N35_032980 [Gossypium stocksii]